MMSRISVTLSKEVFDEIEKRRGSIPRSAYIRDIVQKKLPEYIKELKKQ